MKSVLLAAGMTGSFLMGGYTSALLIGRRRYEAMNEINLQISCPDVNLSEEEYYRLGEGCSER